jgi:WD40-like Beta Propeller Repeat
MRWLVRALGFSAIGLMAGPGAAEAASNGTIAFEIVRAEEWCDQCGPQGESESVGGGVRVWLVRPDGSGLRRLPCISGRRPCTDLDPAYSQDGRRLAVRVIDRLVVLAPGGRRLQTVDPFTGHSLAWGPGGKGIAHAAPYEDPDGERSFRVAVTDLNGKVRPVHETGFVSDIAWSRQNRLAWTAVYERARSGIWVGDLAGRRKTRVTNDGDSLSWSPDGSRIAFLTFRALNVIDAGGGRRRVLTRKCGLGYDEEGGVAWSPDGREIACHTPRGSLAVLNLATMRLRKVATWRRFGDGSVGDISWQPR